MIPDDGFLRGAAEICRAAGTLLVVDEIQTVLNMEKLLGERIIGQDHALAAIAQMVQTAHAGIELYAEVFEAAGALDRLEAFASFHGADFYGLPRNAGKIKLCKESWQVPASQAFIDDVLVPLRAGESVAWRLE